MVNSQNGSETLQEVGAFGQALEEDAPFLIPIGLDYYACLIYGKLSDLKLQLDPTPWAYMLNYKPKHGEPAREATQVTGGFVFWPRPGYEQNKEKYTDV